MENRLHATTDPVFPVGTSPQPTARKPTLDLAGLNGRQHRLIRFLQEDLAIPTESIAIALRCREPLSLLPMILWQYGLVTIEQLDKIFDWLETAY